MSRWFATLEHFELAVLAVQREALERAEAWGVRVLRRASGRWQWSECHGMGVHEPLDALHAEGCDEPTPPGGRLRVIGAADLHFPGTCGSHDAG